MTYYKIHLTNALSPHTSQNDHSLKSLQIINSGKDVEKREPSYMLVEDVNWRIHYGTQHEGTLKKLKLELIYIHSAIMI